MAESTKENKEFSRKHSTETTRDQSKSLSRIHTDHLSDSQMSKISSIYKPHKKLEYKEALKKRHLSKVKELNVRIKGIQRKYHTIQFKKIEMSHLSHLKSIRLQDYCFPIDQSYQEHDDTFKSNFRVFYSNEQFKRIAKIEIDLKEKLYNYELEEKYQTKQIWKGINTINGIKNFLIGLCDYKGHELMQLLDVVIAKVQSGWVISQNLQDKTHEKRTYLIKIDEECLSKISKLPMIIMTESFDISNSTGTLRSMSHNNEYSGLIGYNDYSPTYNDAYNGFYIYAFVYTNNWLNYYIRLYKLFMANNQYLIWTSDELRITDKNGNDIEGHFEYYRQTYIEKYQQFEEHYTIFYKHEETETLP